MKKQTAFFIILIFISRISFSQIDSKAIEQNNKAYNLLSEGKYKEAIKGFDDAIKIDSNYYLIYQNRAYAYSLLKNDSNAIKDYNKAIELNSETAEIPYSLANIYQNNKQYELANENYTKAINNAIKNNEKSNLDIYYFNRGNNFLETKKYNEAISDYDSTEKYNPDYNDLFLNRGIAKYKIKDLVGACLDWKVATTYNIPNSEKYYNENCETIDLKEYIKMPEFPGDNIALQRYIGTNVIYPIHCRNNGKQGVVFVRFRVSENGNVSIIEVSSFAHPDLIIEALKVILSTKGNWTPASIKNKNVSMTYSIPITFRLDNGTNNKLDKINAYKFMKEGKFQKAKSLLSQYLLWNYDTIAIKDYINLKKKTNDTLDIEYYKYMLGKSKTIPSFLKPYIIQKESNSFFKYKENNKQVTIHYNNKFELSKKEGFKYFRIGTWDKNISFFEGDFKDFKKDNSLFQTGSYKFRQKHGLFKIFYLDTTSIYAEGKYKNNNMTGLWKYYYKNGQLKDEVVIIGNEFKVINHYSNTGDTLVKVGTGMWAYKIKSWDGNGDMQVSGKLKNGLKDGIWIITDDKKLLVKEKFNNGKFIEGKYFKEDEVDELYASMITSWIFLNPYIERMERFITTSKEILKEYPFIKSNNY